MPLGASAAIGVGSSIVGGIAGAGTAAADKAAAGQAAAQGNQILSGVQTQTTNNLQPFVGYGQNEGSALEGLLGVGGDPNAARQAFGNFLGSTNYQFQLGQGEDAIKYGGAPAFSSSATAKALDQYAAGTAGNALGGYENALQTGEGQGIGAGSALGQINTGNAEQQSANLLAAAGQEISANNYGNNAFTGALKGVTSGLSSFAGAPGVQSALGGLFSGGGGGGGAAATFNQPGYEPFAATSALG